MAIKHRPSDDRKLNTMLPLGATNPGCYGEWNDSSEWFGRLKNDKALEILITLATHSPIYMLL